MLSGHCDRRSRFRACAASPVAVRFPEGMTHGFLLVRSLVGEIIGQGEMTQVVKEGDLVESRLVFRFKDGFLHDEKVAFSQQRVFTLISYRLLQHGPSFPDPIEIVNPQLLAKPEDEKISSQ